MRVATAAERHHQGRVRLRSPVLVGVPDTLDRVLGEVELLEQSFVLPLDRGLISGTCDYIAAERQFSALLSNAVVSLLGSSQLLLDQFTLGNERSEARVCLVAGADELGLARSSHGSL